MRVLLPLILIIHCAFGRSDSTWYVVVPQMYLDSDSVSLSKLKASLPDSLEFDEWHRCSDFASREFFYSVDSLNGLCFAEPEALYGDSLPEPFYRLWFAVTNKEQAQRLCAEYGGTFSKDTEGYGPGLPGDYLIDFPRLFSDTLTARIAYNEILVNHTLDERGIAFMTSGLYAVLGSCLSKEDALALSALLGEKLAVKVLSLQYQHIDI